MRIKLPNATVDFPEEFGRKRGSRLADALTRAVSNGVLNIAANLEPGFADLKLTASLKPGFADLDFNRPFGKQLKTKPFNAALEPGFADLDFNRNPTR